MGEIADDMVEGLCCSLCGMYYADPEAPEERLYEHGYPAVCWDCWGDLSTAEKKMHQRALVRTV